MSPTTVPEATGYRETSTHADVMRFISALDERRSSLLHVKSFGRTPGGRDLPLLILSSEGVTDPVAARALGRPVVLLQNCIHAGEVEGKEAALKLVRDLLNGENTDLLKKLTVLVVPIFNADGNDAMDTGNRALDIERLIGQHGPQRVGTRGNSANINLNRDYVRQEALEMRLLQTEICQPWQPDLTVDTHATNGSLHRFAMTHDIPHTVESGRCEPIDFMRKVFVPAVAANVRNGYGFESGWYGNFMEDEADVESVGKADPHRSVGEGWITYPHHPRFGSNYRGLGNRLDLLLECYSYLSFEQRIFTTHAWLLETLRAAATRADEICELVAASRQPRDRVAVGYRLEPMDEPVEILTRQPRTLSGEARDIRLPFFARFVGTTLIDRPRGYVLPGHLAPFLRGHGLHLAPAPERALVDVARLERQHAAGMRAIVETAELGRREVSWQREARELPTGTIYLPTDQPLGALAVYLSEPESDDGLVENRLLPTPAPGEEFSVWRVID